MLNKFRTSLIFFLCLVVFFTASSAYSTQSLKTTFENAEQQENDKEVDKSQIEELFYRVQDQFNFSSMESLTQLVFHYVELLPPYHFTSPPTRPPIFFV